MDEIRRFPVTVEDANIFLKTSDTFENFLHKLEENHLDIDSLLIKIKVESFKGKKYVEKNDTEYRIMEFPLSDDVESEKLVDKDSSPKSTNSQLCRLCNIDAVNSIKISSEKDEVAQKINYILPINIFKEDNLPVTVCKTCCTKINVLSEFTTLCLENEQRLLDVATSIPSTENESIETEKDAARLQFKQTCPNFYANILTPQNSESLNFESELNDDNASNLELENILNEAISLNLESESVLNDITNLNLETDTILNEFTDTNPESEDILNEATSFNFEVSIPISEVSKPVYEISKPISERLESIFEISEPICERLEPIYETSELISECLEPIYEISKPISEHLEPIFEISKPISECLEPIYEISKPISERLEPIFEISEPISERLEPIYEISKPISEPIFEISDVSESAYEKSKSIPEVPKPILDRELKVRCTRIENLNITKPIESELLIDDLNAIKFDKNSFKRKRQSLKSKKKRSLKLEFHKSKKQRKDTVDSFGNEIKDLKCILCNLEFLSQDRYLYHLKRHENGNLEEFTCEKCEMDLSTEDDLWKHCQNNCLPEKVAGVEESSDFNAEDQLICNVCNTIFILKERYDFHMELHENGNFCSLKCSECGKVFEAETVLWDHHQTEHKRFSCVHCKRIFRRKASLEFHLKTSGHSHTNENLEEDQIKTTDSQKSKLMITCAKCGARYRRQERYEFHVKRHKLRQIDEFICTECEKEFTNENVLWDHYQYTHRKTESFSCLTCGKVFQKQFLLNKHQLKFKHKDAKENELEPKSMNQGFSVEKKGVKPQTKDTVQGKSLKCVLCGEKVSNFDPDSLNDAVTCAKCNTPGLSLQVDSDGVNVISRREYHCNLCNKHFSTKDRLEYHIMRHSENMDEFICSTCGKKLSTEQALFEHHLFVHKGARPHVCELCGKSYQFRTRLKEHMRSHSGERPFSCEVCGQGFMTNNALRSHLKTHLNDKKFLCQLCSKPFRRQQDLNEHLERHWKNDKTLNLSRFFHCENCAEFFPTIRILKTHLKEHHGIENTDLTDLQPWFECEDCPEKFKHQMSLKSHREKVHKGKTKPIYRCDKCNIIYKTARLFASHMNNNHGGEKRFKCAQCGKEYNQSKSLQNHILIHTGEKPFNCQMCEMSFRTKESRDHHQRKHSGERPYKCPGCDETFATAGQRREHRRKTHEDGNEQPCPECGKICFGERGVRSHLGIHAIEKRKMLTSI